MQSGYGLTRESGEQRTQSVRYQQHRRLPGLLLLACTVRQGLVHAFGQRSEEHTSELQSLMRISYAVFCLKKKNETQDTNTYNNPTTIHKMQSDFSIIKH